MKILPFTIQTTKDKLTSRAGLVCIAQLMSQLKFSELVDRAFVSPKSNRGFRASTFVNAFMLMLNEGGRCLDDLRHIRDDKALGLLLDNAIIPSADAAGNWLRRHGQTGVSALAQINKSVLAATLHHCKQVTLDIDATAVVSAKQEAKWTYLKHQGYMPMVGHIAQTGQILASDFREGNASPAKENLEFIKQCVDALPDGVSIRHLRIDAAGYQARVIGYAIEQNIQFAIRAKMSNELRQMILSTKEWQPLIYRDGSSSQSESTCRLIHTVTGLETPFEVVVQRKPKHGQHEIELAENAPQSLESIEHNGYIYRAIATNRNDLSQSEAIHWYNQRGEHSENRIKELKADFGANLMPCGQFHANALYFSLTTLAYNLFALMRQLLPAPWEVCRAKTLRWRLFALAGKVVRHGRKIRLKLTSPNTQTLNAAMQSIQAFAP